MGIFSGKDYTEDFKVIRKDIEKQSHKGMLNQKEILESLSRLEKRQDELDNSIKELKEFLLDIKSPSIDDEDGEDELYDGAKKGDHISNFKQYAHYKIPRYYDLETARFYSIGGNGAKRELDLSFRELVAIIKGYMNGLNINEIQINPILKDKSPPNVRHYLYIWRTGGFNAAINKVARELGFNPDKLISTECESL